MRPRHAVVAIAPTALAVAGCSGGNDQEAHPTRSSGQSPPPVRNIPAGYHASLKGITFYLFDETPLAAIERVTRSVRFGVRWMGRRIRISYAA